MENGMHLEIRHLRLVAAIADAGGMTRAASRLYLTQSALSHQLKDIESRLGSPLFLRIGRRMVLTNAGERVLASARMVIGELERVEADVKAERDDGPSGLLRIATECYTCYHWLPGVLTSFRQRWPRVEVRIVAEATRRPMMALAAGELDVAVVSSPVGESHKNASRKFGHTPLFEDELKVIVPSDHPLAKREYACAADFAGEQLLLYNVRDEDSTLLSEILKPAGVRPGSVARVELTEAIIEMVKAGLGISVLAGWAAAPYVKSGGVRAVRLTSNGFHRQWSAAFRTDASTPYLEDFVSRLGAEAFPVDETDELPLASKPAAVRRLAISRARSA
jgi:LysR family transcriptional regulator for metE and metH